MIAVEHELLPGDPASVALGRSVVTAAFARSVADASVSVEVVDDAVLAASELVTNAIAVAHERVCLTVEVLEHCARVAVFDDGPGDPVTCPRSVDRVHGRGLSIVEILALRWGVSREPLGKWVWAEFPVAHPAS